jgi:probable rRNA maturation factor
MITLEPPRRLADGAGSGAETEAWSGMGLSRSGLSRFLRVAQKAVGLDGEVDVLLAGDRTVRRLNREFRGKDKATDVLSFPAFAFAPATYEIAQKHAGDLAISLETAQRQAAEQGHSLRDEVRVLLLHGLLHLAGMDHEVDHGEMAAREAELRIQLRLPSGLIARAGRATATADSFAALRNDSQKSKSKGKSKHQGRAGVTA